MDADTEAVAVATAWRRRPENLQKHVIASQSVADIGLAKGGMTLLFNGPIGVSRGGPSARRQGR